MVNQGRGALVLIQIRTNQKWYSLRGVVKAVDRTPEIAVTAAAVYGSASIPISKRLEKLESQRLR